MNRPIRTILSLLITGGALVAYGTLQAGASGGMSCPPGSRTSGYRDEHPVSSMLDQRRRWFRDRIRRQRERMDAMREAYTDQAKRFETWRGAGGFRPYTNFDAPPPEPMHSPIGEAAIPDFPEAGYMPPPPPPPPFYPSFPPAYGWSGPPTDAVTAAPSLVPTAAVAPPSVVAEPRPSIEAPVVGTELGDPAQPQVPQAAVSAPALVRPEGQIVEAADSDSDQVADERDLCPGTDPSIDVDAFGCPKAVPIVLRGVNFNIDSDRLTEESSGILDGVAATLVAHPDIRVEISGHTDSDGDDTENKALSQRRADQVKAYLVGKGVASDRLVARGYGEEQPITGNETAAEKAQNRRVELSRL